MVGGAELEKQRDWIRSSSPIQGYDSVDTYFKRFCNWKEKWVNLNYQATEEEYVEDFIKWLQFDIYLRVYDYHSKLCTMSDALSISLFDETMLLCEEEWSKDNVLVEEDKVLEEMPKPISVDEIEIQEINLVMDKPPTIHEHLLEDEESKDDVVFKQMPDINLIEEKLAFRNEAKIKDKNVGAVGDHFRSLLKENDGVFSGSVSEALYIARSTDAQPAISFDPEGDLGLVLNDHNYDDFESNHELRENHRYGFGYKMGWEKIMNGHGLMSAIGIWKIFFELLYLEETIATLHLNTGNKHDFCLRLNVFNREVLFGSVSIVSEFKKFGVLDKICITSLDAMKLTISKEGWTTRHEMIEHVNATGRKAHNFTTLDKSKFRTWSELPAIKVLFTFRIHCLRLEFQVLPFLLASHYYIHKRLSFIWERKYLTDSSGCLSMKSFDVPFNWADFILLFNLNFSSHGDGRKTWVENRYYHHLVQINIGDGKLMNALVMGHFSYMFVYACKEIKLDTTCKPVIRFLLATDPSAVCTQFITIYQDFGSYITYWISITLVMCFFHFVGNELTLALDAYLIGKCKNGISCWIVHGAHAWSYDSAVREVVIVSKSSENAIDTKMRITSPKILLGALIAATTRLTVAHAESGEKAHAELDEVELEADFQIFIGPPPPEAVVEAESPNETEGKMFVFLHCAMSYNNNEDENSQAASNYATNAGSHLYIATWNDYFTILIDVYYIFDTRYGLGAAIWFDNQLGVIPIAGYVDLGEPKLLHDLPELLGLLVNWFSLLDSISHYITVPWLR